MALSDPYTRSFEGAEALYLESASEEGFNDVLAGTNGDCGTSLCNVAPGTDGNCGTYLCNAGFGYDGPTGLGGLRGAPQLRPPTPLSEPPVSITSSSAVLEGTVEPHGGTITQCSFEYGPTNAYGSRVPCSSTPGPTTAIVPVEAAVSGLDSSTEYHVRLTLSYVGGSGASTDGYEGGSRAGADLTFTTGDEQPDVSTGAASSRTSTSLRLTGTVNPLGIPVTNCVFEYGPTNSYGSSVPCTPPPGSGRTPVAVTALLSGLSPATVYHYRLSATDEKKLTTFGGDQTASTLSEPPSVLTEPASALTPTSATLNAGIELSGGAASSCEFEFDSSQTLLPCVPEPRPGGLSAVTAAVSELTPSTTYRYRIIAANEGGVSYGVIEESTTPASPPSAPVLILPSLTPIVSSTSPAPEAPHAELVGRAFAVGSTAEVRIPIRCLSAATVCSGVISLRTLDAVSTSSNARGKRVLALASSPFTISGGRSETLILKLSGPARSLVVRLRLLRARATVSLRVSAGHNQSSQSIVTLRRH